MSHRFDDQPRSSGPSVVEGGNPSRPAMLVLDPAGEAKHGELPATWRELDDAVHVTWLRLPAVEQAVATAQATLAELAGGGRVHLLAGGEAAPLAELLAMEHPETLASVVLVDPPEHPTGELLDKGTTVTEKALIGQRTTSARETLAKHGVDLHVITFRDADRADRGAPLPLGHPQVVATVRDVLTGQSPQPGTDRTPETPTTYGAAEDGQDGAPQGRLHGLWGRVRRLAGRFRRTPGHSRM